MEAYKIVIVFLLIKTSLESQSDTEKLLGNVVHDIVDRHFSNLNCICIITDQNSHLAQFMPRYIATVQIKMPDDVKETDSPFWDDLDSQSKNFELLLRSTIDRNCFSYVIQVSNYKSIIYSIVRTTKFSKQRGEFRILFVPVLHTTWSGDISVEQQSMDDVFTLKQLSNIPNIVVIKLTPPSCPQKSRLIYKMDNEFENFQPGNITNEIFRCSETLIEFVTHKFVGKNGTEEILLDVWSNNLTDRLWLDNLYKDKLIDMEGKELTIATVDYVPYVVIEEGKEAEGLEMRVITQLSKELNFTMLVINDVEFLWGKIYENGSGNGILGRVAENTAHFAFSATYASWAIIYNWTEFSHSYLRAALNGITPAPKLLPRWHTVIVPFSRQIWVATLVMFLVSSFATHGVAVFSTRFFGLYTCLNKMMEYI